MLTSLGRATRRGVFAAVLAAVLAALLGVLFAQPASAHAELISSTPSNGQHLQEPPDQVRMTFTEGVVLVDNGIRLVDSTGRTVPTPDPVVDVHTITWRMPAELVDESYTVTWRVVSSDGHPVSGAFSFTIGPGTVAGAPGTPSTAGSAATAPWPVLLARLAGYLAFALVAGVVVFVLWCSAGDRSNDPALQRLARVGLLGGMIATVAGLLTQGPYTAGLPISRLLDPQLVRETVETPFGTAMVGRLALYAVMAALVWRLPVLVHRPVRWLVPAGIIGTALTIAATGHGNASGRLVDLAVVAVHALTAAIWVGGLGVLMTLGRSAERRELHRFGALAVVSVLTLIVTGTLNSLRELATVEQLWQTRYGLLLVAKLALVGVALGAASTSRRRLRQDAVPVRSVRVEGVFTVAVLALTALLSMTSPPSQGLRPDAVVAMSLGDLGKAELTVLPATTAGSELRVILTDDSGRPLRASRVQLNVANPGRRVAAIPVPLARTDGSWVADYRFPLPGTWTATLTVAKPGEPAVVAAAKVTITD